MTEPIGHRYVITGPEGEPKAAKAALHSGAAAGFCGGRISQGIIRQDREVTDDASANSALCRDKGNYAVS